MGTIIDKLLDWVLSRVMSWFSSKEDKLNDSLLINELLVKIKTIPTPFHGEAKFFYKTQECLDWIKDNRSEIKIRESKKYLRMLQENLTVLLKYSPNDNNKLKEIEGCLSRFKDMNFD